MENHQKHSLLQFAIISIALIGILLFLVYFFYFLPVSKLVTHYKSRSFTQFAAAPTPLSLIIKRDPFGNLTASVIGIVKKTYEKDERYYMEIDTIVNDGIISLLVDFGAKDTRISEQKRIVINKANVQLATPIGTEFDDTFRIISVEQFVNQNKSLENKVINIDILISMPVAASGSQCNQTCQQRRNELSAYKSRNESLNSIHKSFQLSLLKKQTLTIGVPYQISISQ